MNINLRDEEIKLIERWLNDPTFVNWAKRSNEQDTAKWEQYFNNHLQSWELGKVARSMATGIPFRDIPEDQVRREEALSQLIKRLEEKTEGKHSASKVRRLSRSRLLLAVASVALVLVASGFIYFQLFYNPQVILATDYGEQLEHVLPDGSKVTLNANSTIKYFSRTPRAVWLDGEAFFEVAKIPQTKEKFNVWTTDLAVTVLGTSFNVNTRNDQTQVFLEEGKVALELEEMKAEIIEMEPGDLVTYSRKEKKLGEKKKNASALENASWKEGSLIFKDTPLPEALSDIEDIYGIQLVVQTENLNSEVISGGVPIKNLEVTLVTLSEVYGIQIKEEGGRYFLSGQKD